MTEKKQDFWRSHSAAFLENAFSHTRQGRLEHPDGYGVRTGNCGDTVEIFLDITEQRIDSVSYQLNGCIHTNACVNALIGMVEGKCLEEAWEIAPEAVISHLETLPKDHYHCAELAVGALYQALADHRNRR
jgi:nitrogen fixation NifU-like protein